MTDIVNPFPLPKPETWMAIPDFVGGLLYGLTKENHLTEIESCWTGGEVVEKDLMAGIHDLKHGGTDYEIQAILEFGLAALNVPIALKTCKSMGPDIKAIESWATIFEDPTKLAATVTKRYALHRKAIKADIATTESEWAAAEYFKAGVTAADLLELAVGPINVPAAERDLPEPVGMSVKAPYEFADGFLHGFLVDNNLTSISNCLTDDAASMKYIEKAMAAVIENDMVQASLDLHDFYTSLPTDIAACEAAKPQVIAIDQWAQIFKKANRSSLVLKVSKNYALHKRAVNADRDLMKADWAAGMYYQTGFVAADLLKILVGPVTLADSFEPYFNEMVVSFPTDPTAVPDFVAGFIYGMTGDNDLTEIEACWNGTTLMYDEVEKAIACFKKGGADYTTQGFLYLSLVALQFPQAVSTCKGMDDDIAAIEAWGQIFTDPVALSSTVTKHYLLHKKAATADIDATEAEWAAGHWFDAGVDFAALATLLVGPI